jgi:hypothetical protein
MSNLTGQEHLNPNDPAYYAPRRLRERAKLQSPASQIRPEAVAPISSSASLRRMASDDALHPLPTVAHPVGLARERRRTVLFSGGALVAAFIGMWAIVALFYLIMVPASRPSDAGSTSSEITQSMVTVLPQPGQGDGSSKPALAEFQGLLASDPPGQNATQARSEQLLQQFLQWGQKPNLAETSRSR